MATERKADAELVEFVTKLVVQGLYRLGTEIPVGVSNRHIHLDREDMDVLFGVGSELTYMKDLAQPGQYACEETVSIQGPKGALHKVRVLGPLRPETQIEISVADGFVLGVKPPVRESGVLEGTPGLEIIGPKGTVKKEHGVIAALRHIHMPPDLAGCLGIRDKERVSIDVGGGERSAILNNVLVRVSDRFALEMHIDVDEANAVGLKNGAAIKILST